MTMKSGFAVTCAVLAIAAGSCLSGCATMGIGKDQSAKTSSKIQTVQSDMKQAVVQADATDASLRTLMKPDEAGPKRAFEAYKENVSKMEKVGKQIEKHDDQMRAQGKEYFAEWEKKGTSYADPQLRDASEERRAELSQVYDRIPEASAGTKEALNTYLSELRQIQDYLATDLTPKGIDAISPVAEKALADGQKLKDSVRPAISAMDRAMAELAHEGKGAAAGGKKE